MNSKTIDKKKNVVRLLVFILFAFAPGCIAVPIINSCIGEKLYVAKDYITLAGCVGILMMLVPSIAHLLTRIVTKEGWKNLYLWPRFKGNMKYYFAAIWVIIAEDIIFSFIIWRAAAPSLPISELYSFEPYGTQFAGILLTITSNIFLFFPYFGEEWGWRGYMMPKLIELMGKPAAVVVGGIIWGLWHAPITIAGHNFGVDYPFYPYLGIGIMCVFCTLLNAFLTYITEKTKSIYPAAIFHGMNNSMGATIWLMGFCSENMLEKIANVQSYKMFLYLLPSCLVVAIISMILFMKKDKLVEE